MGTMLFLLFLLSPAVLGLMVARCPEGWKARGGTDQCYLVHSHGSDRTFNDARIYCQGRGGDLANIDTAGLRDWLGQLVAATGYVGQNAYMWVGARNVNGEWMWIETDQLVDHSILQWEGTGSGDCAAFTADTKLIKQDCSQKLKFICHRNIEIPLACDYTSGWEDAMDRCYKKSTQSNSWHDSEVECLIDGGHLVSIETDAEQQLAHDLALEEHDKVWIGYTEENHAGVFTWADGSDSNETYWNEGQPDLSLKGFGAAVVDNDDPSGLWVVEKITNDYHYLCEKAMGSCLPGWETFENSCYYFNTEGSDSLVWDDAKSTCEAVKAKMVVLDTEAEDAFFRTHMPEADTLWIGLYSKPGEDIYWTDETPMESKNFTHMTDEDKNSAIDNTDKQCVYLQDVLDTDGATGMSSWVPSDCTMPRHYACEAEVGAQLTLVPPASDRYCPDGGWVQNNDFCYFFSAEEKTWTGAGNDCKKKHNKANLVSIVTWGEQDFVFNNQLAAGWTGLNDMNSAVDAWEWSDSTTVTILNWNDGEPNGENENCVEMIYETGKWNDLPCSQMLAYTCKMPASTLPIGTVTTTTAIPDTSACGFDWTENPTTGECYRVEVQELSFDDAKLHCNELFYYEGQSQPDLVSIYTAEEQNFVFSLVTAQHLSQVGVWMGMINDWDKNYWTDGTPTDYYNFEDGEPNSMYMEQCIEMYTSTGRWNDAYCTERLPFVCEKKGKNYVAPQPPPRPDVLCPTGWNYWDNHCYYFPSDMADWFTADANCKGMLNSSLTSVTNQDENDYLQGLVKDSITFLWLGLRDDDNGNDWHWTDGSLFDWKNWGEGEPNNYNNEEHCGEMRPYDAYYNGQWNDASCSTQNRYMCKISVRTCPDTWAYNDGKCYYVSDTEATRNEGLVKCQEVNTQANLVNIHSEEENQFFMGQLFQSSDSCWLGLQYNGSSWMWADGTAMDYENWNTGEPNDMEAELCGEMIDYPNEESHGKWNNLNCEQSRAYGCELYPTHLIGCEDGWEPFGDYCYWNSDTNDYGNYGTYHSAKKRCEDMDANLVSIHSAEEKDFVTSIALSAYYNVYIGFTDIGHKGLFTWDDGTTVVYTSVESFSSSQISSAELCTTISPWYYDGDWIFGTCTNYFPFMCKKPKEATPLNPVSTGCNEEDSYHEASCYNNPGTSDSWENAKSDCESRGQHLVVLENRFETAFFSALVGELGERVWLGLSGTIASSGSVTFTWITGQQLDSSNWDKYEPDPEHGTCVSASGDRDNPGLWAVVDCSHLFQYFCEYERVGYTTQSTPTTKAPVDYCLYEWEKKDQRCYKVMSDPAVWGDGEARCEQFGAYLTSIGDEAEQRVILDLSGMEDVVAKYGSVWVGLVMGSETGYEWTDGSATDYVNWAEGQPDSHGGRESCVSADGRTLELSDSVCLTHLPFICEAPLGAMLTTATEPTKPPLHMCGEGSDWFLYNDYCYKFKSSTDEEAQTWWGAHKLCRDEGGELASILSSEENYWIESMIYDKSELAMWIGGREKLGTGYEWIDNEPFVYDNWALGEPNNVNDQEDCISIYTNNQGYWNDQNCGHTAGRICKRPNGETRPPLQTTQVPDGHCPDGWLHTGTKCVYFITDRLNFTTSRQVCKEMGSKMDLASIHSAAEQAYLTAAMVMLEEHMWIGMSYESSFVWVDQTSVTYTNWGPNEPNGGYQKEECVEVSSKTGYWNDITCSAEYGGICMMTQDPSLPDHHTPSTCSSPHQTYTAYNGACYRVFDSNQTWKEAEATCASEDAHLVSIMTMSEDSFVWAVGQQVHFSSLWIGLSNKQKLDTFTWSDGWPTIYTNWGREEPATNLTTGSCVTVDVTNGAWYTKLCDDTHTFICKYTNETAPTPDPPTTGYCPDKRWKDFNGGYCYLFSNDTKQWSDANMFCLQEKSHLASIHSDEEMRLITLATVGYNEPLWIGLVETSGGEENWSDGTSLNYINWQDGEPNSGAEQCTEVATNTGYWNDVDCVVTRYYICKMLKLQDVATATPDTPTTPNPGGGGDKSGITGGGIAGIVIAVLFVIGAVGFVGFTYIQRKPKSANDPGQRHSFENAMYGEGSSKRTGGVDLSAVMDGSDA